MPDGAFAAAVGPLFVRYTERGPRFAFRAAAKHANARGVVHGGMLTRCRSALAEAERDMDFLRLSAGALDACPSVSLDYAIMERTERIVVVPAEFGWTDVGSWTTLWEIGPKDDENNVVVGQAVAEDSSGCYLRGEDVTVAALGVEDLVVVATSDVVLVAHKSYDRDLKTVIESLKTIGCTAATETAKVHRPWGYYRAIECSDRFQVKHITVNPGAKLSLQKHFHRAEHWVVVHGTALVTRDDEQMLLSENESIYLPIGSVHRLENPGRLPLDLIEVQSGAYLGEDDIVRLDDVYRRIP